MRHQNRNRNNCERWRAVGVDTETHDGRIFLIEDSDKNRLEHPNITFDNIAKFLLKHEGEWVFFYYLGFDADCILRLLPADVLKSYKYNKRLQFHYEGYTITYIERKRLTIQSGNHSVSCYDIAQYYDNRKLVKAYEENIKKPLPALYLETKSDTQFFTLRYFLRNKKRIRKYCIHDCILAKELADNWIDTFYGAFGFYPRNWISAGYLAEKVLINNNISIPFFDEIPYEAQDLAWKSFYGGRFELIKRGYIGKCWLYDINSAYPYALTSLPDLTYGRWSRLCKIHPQAAVGFFHIIASIDDGVKVAPFPFRTRRGSIIYPVGQFETYVSLEELKAVRGDSRIKYTILEGQQFIPYDDNDYPFKQFIEEQYYNRLALKLRKDPLERAIKIVLNSIYGKTAQRVCNVMGNIFNPAIAAYTTGYARAQLYRFMRDHDLEKCVVAFATDSIAVTKEIMGLDSDRLGEMKLDKRADDVSYLSNGFYGFGGKWKQRGVGYDREKKAEINHLETRVGDDGQLYISVETTKTTHIKSGILFNKLKSVGKIERYEKKIGLNSDKKRLWDGDLKSLNDRSVCDSAPININQVSDLIAKESNVEWEDEQEEKYEPESEL